MRTLGLAIVVVSSLTTSERSQAQWSVVVLHPSDAFFSQAYGCDADSQVGIVGYSDGRQIPAMWRGSAESLTDLTPPDSIGGMACAVLGSRIVGSTYDSTTSHARLWLGDAEHAIDLNPPSAIYSAATALSETQVVGYAVVGGITRASLWTNSPGSWIDLSPPEADFSIAAGVANGVQVGYVRIAGRYRAVKWTGSASSLQFLTPADDPRDSYAFAIDGDQIAGVWGEGGMWQGAQCSWADLRRGSELTNYGYPYAVHGGRQAGDAAFCEASSGGVSGAAIWSGTPMSGLDLSSFVVGDAADSHARGVWSSVDRVTVTGWGWVAGYPDTVAIAWMLPNPAPSRCAADLNEDGFVNGDDYDCFAEQFDAGTGPDFNADCFVNADDYDQFAEAFEAGC